jgi:2-oxoisovalerate dehydrogenase E2 component (dihydrolipoyl transacylase)
VSRYVFKLPDLGEGTVDAEIVTWHVRAGDEIREDAALVEVMTEKATVEVPSPVSGRVVSVSGAPGERIAVGSELAVFETGAAQASVTPPAAAPQLAPAPKPSAPAAPAAVAPARGGRILTSPAIRRRAREAGIDLAHVAGSGPNGRILPDDIQAHLSDRTAPTPLHATSAPSRAPSGPAASEAGTEEIRIIGVRRLIAERMSESARTIPHFSYVEEVDVTELERLRTHLNATRAADAQALTYLPFLVLALVRTLREHPQCNALYDASRGVVVRHAAVHVGIATQTPEGLKVPVVRDAQAKSLTTLAAEIRRVSEAARTNQATRAELTGSTISVTSLGKLGGIASTPIINAPELAIIGVNRALERAVVLNGAVTVRRMMNLSSSFDHRFIDGYDAAAMIQALKERLEHPATIFADL